MVVRDQVTNVTSDLLIMLKYTSFARNDHGSCGIFESIERYIATNTHLTI